MTRKRYKPEEIVAKLRQVEVLVSQGRAGNALALGTLIDVTRLDINRRPNISYGRNANGSGVLLRAILTKTNAWRLSRKATGRGHPRLFTIRLGLGTVGLMAILD